MNNSVKELITQYYAAFNAWDMKRFMALLTDDVIHDISQGKREQGKEAFQKFMAHMDECYQEQAKEIVIMVHEEGKHAATEFVIEGTYKKTDGQLPPAKGQTYRLPVGTFFEIRGDKISRVSTHYNLQDWLKQISA